MGVKWPTGDRSNIEDHRADEPAEPQTGGDVVDAPVRRRIDRRAVSILKACELTSVSRRTIYNWMATGKVEYVRTAGGFVRIFIDTLWRDRDGR